MLIWLNRRVLTDAIEMRGVYLIALIWSVLLFGVASVVTVYSEVTKAFGG